MLMKSFPDPFIKRVGDCFRGKPKKAVRDLERKLSTSQFVPLRVKVDRKYRTFPVFSAP